MANSKLDEVPCVESREACICLASFAINEVFSKLDLENVAHESNFLAIRDVSLAFLHRSFVFCVEAAHLSLFLLLGLLFLLLNELVVGSFEGLALQLLLLLHQRAFQQTERVLNLAHTLLSLPNISVVIDDSVKVNGVVNEVTVLYSCAILLNRLWQFVHRVLAG